MPYHNPWIPKSALRYLTQASGSILDVGGGAAPYRRATHILDILPFDAQRLTQNAWETGDRPRAGGPWRNDRRPRTMADERTERVEWSETQYTQWDVCDGKPWPFKNDTFDLGLSSHCLEDLPSPFHAVRELSRVCRRVLIITPSRLIEQMMGINNLREVGFRHHHWMVFPGEKGEIVFQRKSERLYRDGCHVRCPAGKTLPIELGSIAFFGSSFEPREKTFPDEAAELADLRAFVNEWEARGNLFVRDPRARSWRYWVYRWKQRWWAED